MTPTPQEIEQLVDSIYTSVNPETLGRNLLFALVILILGWWLAHLASRALRRAMRGLAVEETLVLFLGRVTYYVLLAVVIVLCLAQIGIPTASLVAMLGAATLAICLALRDSLNNVASGVLLVGLRPYQVGDFVEINGRRGFVVAIDLFHSRLRTRDNTDVHVPNGRAMAENIVNFSRRGPIRLNLAFSIDHGDDLAMAKRLIDEILRAEPRVVAEPAPGVLVGELKESGVILLARPYARVEDEVDVSSAVIEQVKLAFDAAGISTPHPQHDVRLIRAG